MDQLEMFRRQLRKKPDEEIETDSPAVSDASRCDNRDTYCINDLRNETHCCVLADMSA